MTEMCHGVAKVYPTLVRDYCKHCAWIAEVHTGLAQAKVRQNVKAWTTRLPPTLFVKTFIRKLVLS